jgi:hypothetical protein
MIKLNKTGIIVLEGIEYHIYVSETSGTMFLIDAIAGNIFRAEYEILNTKPIPEVVENAVNRLVDRLRLTERNGHSKLNEVSAKPVGVVH